MELAEPKATCTMAKSNTSTMAAMMLDAIMYASTPSAAKILRHLLPVGCVDSILPLSLADVEQILPHRYHNKTRIRRPCETDRLSYAMMR